MKTDLAPFIGPKAAELLKALKDILGTQQLAYTSALFREAAAATKSGWLLSGQKLRFGKHFEPDFQAYLYDPTTGTLGLIRTIVREERCPREEKPGKPVGEQVRQALEQASYLRFLTLSEAARKRELDPNAEDQAPLRPLSIELAFLLEAGEPGLRNDVSLQIANAVRQTEFLHALGVAILPATRRTGDGGTNLAMEPADLQRAFPWLLRHTGRWLAPQESSHGNGESRGQSLQEINLSNYRRPGCRTITLEPNVRVHLVHGHNGSGKSSLVEAVEYAMTGRIERFRGRPPSAYQPIIQHTPRDGPATVTFRFTDGSVRKWEPGSGPENDGLSPGLSPNAFRLDQTVMNDLLGPDKVQRARIFVEAFFPEDGPRLAEAEKTRHAAAQSRQELGDSFSAEIIERRREGQTIEAAVEERLACLGAGADPGQRLDRNLADGLWPNLEREMLQELMPLSAEFQNLYSQWQKELPLVKEAGATLQKIAAELRRLRGNVAQTLGILRGARHALDAANQWKSSPSGPAGDNFREELNNWLHQEALADLKCKLSEVLDVYSDALANGFQGSFFPAIDQTIRMEVFSRTALAAEAAAAVAERDRLFAKLQSTQMGTAVSASSESTPTPPPHLTDAQIRALDHAARWLAIADLPEPGLLGTQLSQAFQQRVPSLGSLSIGQPGWATAHLARLDALEQACQQLQRAPEEELDGSRRLALLANAGQLHAEARKAAEALANTFLRKLGVRDGAQNHLEADQFYAALNEMMALFTPSRWEYEDLQLQPGATDETGEGGQNGLELTSGASRRPADLRLNTAQLNIFTVALFLLCAIRRGNSLRLLILDDPLQNMDEVTVTTLARGLGKFVRKLSAEWRVEDQWHVMLLFHGEDDLQRFIDEIPDADVHRLPWLAVPAPVQSTAPDAGAGPPAPPANRKPSASGEPRAPGEAPSSQPGGPAPQTLADVAEEIESSADEVLDLPSMSMPGMRR